MSLAKVIEVIAEGSSVENALENAAKEVSESLRGVRSIYTENFTALVDEGKIKAYRVNAKVTFIVEE